MKKTLPVLVLAAALFPGGIAGQGFGLAARLGTLGGGAEAALGLTNSLVLRGGVSFMPLDIDTTVDDIDVTVTLPKTWYTIGLDLYLTGALRIGGGFLFKPDAFDLSSSFNTDQEIGGILFTPAEIGTLTGSVDPGTRAPYLLIGFGKHTSTRVGLSLDIGAAFLSDPDVSLSSDGTAASAVIEPELEREAQSIEDDIPTWAKIWPILSLGVRVGIG